MTFYRVIKLNLCFVILLLSGCNQSIIETTFDEAKGRNVCSLKNHKILSDSTYFTWHKLFLNLDTIDSNKVFAKLELMAYGKDVMFRQNPVVFFTVTNGDNITKEIKIKCSDHVTQVEWIEGIKKSQLSIIMTNAEIIEIANAKKVVLSIDTIDGSLEGEMNKETLQPIREFVFVCLNKR